MDHITIVDCIICISISIIYICLMSHIICDNLMNTNELLDYKSEYMMIIGCVSIIIGFFIAMYQNNIGIGVTLSGYIMTIYYANKNWNRMKDNMKLFITFVLLIPVLVMYDVKCNKKSKDIQL